MVLESTIVCADNSEWMRNGDYLPTRLQAQQDAVSLVCHTKTRQNPENNVGLLTLASPQVLVTLTTDIGKLLGALHEIKIKGKINLLTGIKTAHLALKHRQGKNHRMRIVVFIGSPVDADEKELTKVAKKLKKEKVNIDIVQFGQENESSEKLNNFVNTINGKDGNNSHLVTVPPGPVLSDALKYSPILVGEDGVAPVGNFDFDVDPSIDPELALALRMSLEEERQRQDDENRDVPATEESGEAMAPIADNEEAMLQQALAMSSQGMTSQPVTPAPRPDFSSISTLSEEEQIALAVQMSLQGVDDDESLSGVADTLNDGRDSETPSDMDTSAQGAESDDFSEVMSDPAFLQSVLETLPGVDPSSEAIQNVVGSLTKNDSKPEPMDEDKKEDNKK